VTRCLAWKSAGTALYQTLPSRLRESLQACEPLREVPADRAAQTASYQPWKATHRA